MDWACIVTSGGLPAPRAFDTPSLHLGQRPRAYKFAVKLEPTAVAGGHDWRILWLFGQKRQLPARRDEE